MTRDVGKRPNPQQAVPISMLDVRDEGALHCKRPDGHDHHRPHLKLLDRAADAQPCELQCSRAAGHATYLGHACKPRDRRRASQHPARRAAYAGQLQVVKQLCVHRCPVLQSATPANGHNHAAHRSDYARKLQGSSAYASAQPCELRRSSPVGLQRSNCARKPRGSSAYASAQPCELRRS